MKHLKYYNNISEYDAFTKSNFFNFSNEKYKIIKIAKENDNTVIVDECDAVYEHKYTEINMGGPKSSINPSMPNNNGLLLTLTPELFKSFKVNGYEMITDDLVEGEPLILTNMFGEDKSITSPNLVSVLVPSQDSFINIDSNNESNEVLITFERELTENDSVVLYMVIMSNMPVDVNNDNGISFVKEVISYNDFIQNCEHVDGTNEYITTISGQFTFVAVSNTEGAINTLDDVIETTITYNNETCNVIIKEEFLPETLHPTETETEENKELLSNTYFKLKFERELTENDSIIVCANNGLQIIVPLNNQNDLKLNFVFTNNSRGLFPTTLFKQIDNLTWETDVYFSYLVEELFSFYGVKYCYFYGLNTHDYPTSIDNFINCEILTKPKLPYGKYYANFEYVDNITELLSQGYSSRLISYSLFTSTNLIKFNRSGFKGLNSIINSMFMETSIDFNNIDIPEYITKIESNAFNNCHNINDLIIPNSIEEIDDYAFIGCSNIKSITIGDRVKKLSEKKFQYGYYNNDYEWDIYCYGLPELTSINVSENNPYYSSEDGILYNKDKTELLYIPINHSATSYTTPQTVTTINTNDFHVMSSKNMKEYNITENVISIGGSWYNRGTSLNVEKINIQSLNAEQLPDHIVVDEYGAVYTREKGVDFVSLILFPAKLPVTEYTIHPDCTYMSATGETITNNFTIEKINWYHNIKLWSYTMPNSCFMNFTNLKYFNFGDLPTFETRWLLGTKYVEEFMVNNTNTGLTTFDGVLYKITDKSANSYDWFMYPSGKKDKVYEVKEGVKVTAYGCFNKNEFITKVIFPKSLTTINDATFCENKNLEEIVFKTKTAPTFGNFNFRNSIKSNGKFVVPINADVNSYEKIISNYGLSNWKIEFSNDEVLIDEIKIKIIKNNVYDSTLTNLKISNAIGEYDESNNYYSFKNVSISSRNIELLQNEVKIGEFTFSDDICYVFIGDNPLLTKHYIFNDQNSIDECEVISSNDGWYYDCNSTNTYCGLRSKKITHNQSTIIKFDGFIGDVTINYMVSSENTFDYCIINDSIKLYNTTNEGEEVTINSKTNTLTIKYLKDGSVSNGIDGVIIKSIKGVILPNE